MREAIGGTWILGFVVVFIVLFISYLAVSINYSKAFRVKNKIINIIEENDGFSRSASSSGTSTEDKIMAYLEDVGYATVNSYAESCAKEDAVGIPGGYCVRKVCSGKGCYYKVTSFIKIEFPLIEAKFLVPIRGETKVLYYVNDGFDNK